MEDEMNTNKSHIYLLFTILIIGTLLSGCDFSTKIKIGEVRLGMFGDHQDSHLYYSYRTFTGVESDRIQAEKGQTIAFSYQVSIDKGSLIIEWQDPQGEVLWHQVYESDAQNALEIPVETAGTHTIIIQGNDTGGSFEVSWQVN